VKTSGKGKELQRDMLLRGESGNAGKLIGPLEDSKLVQQAAPRSPTTKIQPGPGEVFDLGAQLRPLPPPVPTTPAPAAAVATPADASADAGKSSPAAESTAAKPPMAGARVVAAPGPASTQPIPAASPARTAQNAGQGQR
jgi:hypothetical protein